MRNTAFDGTDDIMDSHDIIERIEELDALLENMEDPELSDEDRNEAADEFDRDEYDALKALAEEAEGDISDWAYGETFISEDYFTAYCMETLADIGYIPRDIPGWIVIDEEATAENMKVDYTEFEYMGTTYYAR